MCRMSALRMPYQESATILKPTWAMLQVPGHPKLGSKTLSQETNKQTPKKHNGVSAVAQPLGAGTASSGVQFPAPLPGSPGLPLKSSSKR